MTLKLETVVAVAQARQALAPKPDDPAFAWDKLQVEPYGRLTHFFPKGLTARARNRCGRIAEWECPGPILVFEGEHEGSHSKTWVFTLRQGQLKPLAHPHVATSGSLCYGSAPNVLTALMQLNPESVAGLQIHYEYDKGGPETACKRCEVCGQCEAHYEAHVANPHLHHQVHIKAVSTIAGCGNCRTCGTCTCPICSCVGCVQSPTTGDSKYCHQCTPCAECGNCSYHNWHRGTCRVAHTQCVPTHLAEDVVRCPCGFVCGKCCECGAGHTPRNYERQEDTYDPTDHAHCHDCGNACSCEQNICINCDRCRDECCRCDSDDDDY